MILRRHIHNFIRKWVKIFGNAVVEFFKDNTTKYCASLSYYALFSLPALLLILVSISSMIFGKDVAEGEMHTEISRVAGSYLATQIQIVLHNLQTNYSVGTIAIVSFIYLILNASGIFSEIQNTIYILWRDTSSKRKWHAFLKDKLLAIAMIGIMSVLLTTSMILNALLSIIQEQLSFYIPISTIIWIKIGNNLLFMLVIWMLFFLIYAALPAVKLRWKYILAGSFFAAIFFFLGRYLMTLYLTKIVNISIYGAAGSLILFLSWIYYSSAIFYFGAQLSKSYAEYSVLYEDEDKNASLGNDVRLP